MATKKSGIVAGIQANSQAAPQNPNTYGTPGSGGISPLLAQYQQWTIGQGGSPYNPLPRDAAQFLLGQFGPLAPIQPMPIDEPGAGRDRPEPRRFQYPVAWNMPHSPPGTEGLKLTDFTTLRTYADWYSVARAAIQVRKAEVRGLEWDIHPTKEAEKAMRGDPKAHRDFADRRLKAVKFFQRPDPDYTNFSSWIDALLEDVFVVDALSLYLHPTRMTGKGLLGSDLAAIELIDGTTIRPLLNLQGGRPQPPSPAYQQYLQGIPRVDLLTLLTGDDVADLDEPVREYRGDQLLYLPYTARAWTPYGFPPVERAIVPVTTGLRKQQYQLDYFDEGTLPGAYFSPGENSGWTPNQIKDFQDALNAIAGDPAWKHKAIALPPGSSVTPMRPNELADMFDEIVMTQVCMAFDVMPMELGVSPRVSSSQSSGAAHQMAKASEDINERKALKPMLKWLRDAIFNPILQQVCGQDDMAWTWEGLEEGEDEETKTNLIVNQVSHALLSIDEGRAELGKTPWGLPETSDPGILTATGFTPLGQWNPITEEPGQQPGEAPPPDQQGGPTVPGGPPGPGGGPGGPPSFPQPPGGHIVTIGPGNKAPAPFAPPAPPQPPGAQGAGSSAKKPAAGNATKGESLLKPTLAEVDSLRRHLNKGRDARTWQCRFIDPAWLPDIQDAIVKGVQPDAVMATVADHIEKTWNVVFDPSKHPRGAGGKFGPGGGGQPQPDLGELGQWGTSTSGRINVSYSGHAPSGGGKGPKGKKPKKGGKGKKGQPSKKQMAAERKLQAEAQRLQQERLRMQQQALRQQMKQPPPANDPVAWQYYDSWYNANNVSSQLSADPDLTKAKPGHGGGNAETLRRYWLTHIPWGTPGDFDECVEQVTQHAHMSPEQAKGYCNLLHHRALGFYPATHAAMERGHKCGGLLDARDIVKGFKPYDSAYAQMLEDYPPDAISWMKGLHWHGPEQIPADKVDFEDMPGWRAAHEPDKVERFKEKISKKLAKDKPIKPVVLVNPPGNDKLIIIDGHHRSMAYRELGEPIRAYVASVPSKKGPWLETHSSQLTDDGDHPTRASKSIRPETVKVGPKGYEHGWIFVGAPSVGDKVFHPQLGHGEVTHHEAGKETHVKFDSGKTGKFTHAPRPGQARDFAKEPKVLTGKEAFDHMPTLRGSHVIDEERYRDKPFFGQRVYTQGEATDKRTIDYHSFDERALPTALSGYATNGYRRVNGDLRSGKRKKNKWLDEAFNRAPATEHPMLTHRGVEKASELFGPVGSKVGQIFNDKGFVSTSADRSVADQFRKSEYAKTPHADSAIINMHLPAGIKAVTPFASTPREQEILLRRDSNFKVVGDKVIDGTRTIDLEMIP